MAVERAGVRTGINLPLGSSILAVGMKQAMPLPATVAG
jgi:hypothetical protein